MKMFVYAVAIGVTLGVVEFVALEVITADLRYEMSAKRENVRLDTEKPVQSLYVAQRDNHGRMLLGDEVQGRIEDASSVQYGANLVQGN